MKNLIFIIIILVVFSTTLKSQWTIYQTNTTMQLNKIQFINENTGFAAGGGAVYSDSAVFFKTNNGGMNWIKYVVNDSTSTPIDEVYGLFFVNSNTGYVCGTSWNVFKTTNSGHSWVAVRLPYYSLTQIYNALYFIDENTGYAAGRYGYVCKTTNGGLNWELKADLDGNLHGVYFVNQNTGFFSSASGGVYKTTNGGLNFSFYYLGDFGFESVRFINDTIGFICGRDAYFHSGVFKTTNCGLTWEILYVCDYLLYDVFFVNQNSGYLSGQTVIFKTTTSGINWYSLNIPDNNGFLSMFFITPDYGFMSGGNGKIYKTTSGGVWIKQISSEVPERFKISNCYPNPFNPSTKIRFEVPRAGLVKISVFDVTGREVAVLVNETLQAGVYETTFDANGGNGIGLTSGVYFCRMEAGGFSETKRMVLVK